MAYRQPNISQEPCTLVYTLIDNTIIDFDQFSLIVRSLHSYMVDSIVPNPQYNNVHVKLNYQASVANATAKLGSLQSAVGVTKLSSYIKESEFSELEQLRRRFGIGAPDTRGPTTNRRPRGGRARVFKPRPAPYSSPARPVFNHESIESPQYPDAQDFPYEEDTVLDIYSSPTSKV